MASVSQPSLLHPPFHPSRPSSSRSANSSSSLRPQLQLDINSSADHHSTHSHSSAGWSPSPHSHQGDFVLSPSRDDHLAQPFQTPDQANTADRRAPAHSPGREKGPSQARPVPSEIFYQLDQIKRLHTEIASEHAKLERVGGGGGREGEGEREQKAEGGKAGKEGGNKEKGSGYERMADEFEQRKERVEKVMNKLSQLSDSLKKFHSLPSPVLFPSHSHSHSTKTHHNSNSQARQSPPTTPETQLGARALRTRIQSHDG